MAAFPKIATIPVFDGHNDTLLALAAPGTTEAPTRTFFKASDTGHIDYPRARAGGLGGGFFAIFTPSNGAHDINVPSAIGQTTMTVAIANEVDQLTALKFTVDLAADLFRLEREG